MSSSIKAKSKSSLFLMELILVILFFSISSAICMKVFANAKVKTDFSRNVTNATFVAESIAESYKEDKGDLDSVALSYNVTGVTSKGNVSSVVIYLDKEWNACEKADAVFKVDVVSTKDGRKSKANIKVSGVDSKDIYELNTTYVDLSTDVS